MKRKPPALSNIGMDPNHRAIDSFHCDYPVELHHGFCHAFLSDFEFDGRELVHRYPPYVQSTRKSQYRYRLDCTYSDYVRLFGVLKSLPYSVMISGYPFPLYNEHLSDEHLSC